MIKRRPLSSVVGVLACSGAFAQEQTFFLGEVYQPADVMPFSIYGQPVGYTATMTVRLLEDYDPSAIDRVLLWMNVDDIDDPKEAQIFINEQGPIPITKSWLGEGISYQGFIELQPQILRGGDNKIRFVFTDNLGGTTRGYEILEAAVVVVPSGEARSLSELYGEPNYIYDIPDYGKVAAYESTLTPMVLRIPRSTALRWMPHMVRRGDGQGGWLSQPAEIRYLNSSFGEKIIPAGLIRMDNGQIFFLCSWSNGKIQRPIITVSQDEGDTWSDWYFIKRVMGQPTMLAKINDGGVSFQTRRFRVFSSDYGKTFPRRAVVQPLPEEGDFLAEGNPLVEQDSDGQVILAMIGSSADAPGAFFRLYVDGGHRYQDQISPDSWFWNDTFDGRTQKRGASDGSLVRAANGTLIAALRTDTLTILAAEHDDQLQGLGISLSYDDGLTWQPIKKLFDFGRHHAHLQRLKDDRLLMHYAVSHEINKQGRYTSFNRGCEAMISSDNGNSWDTTPRVVIDSWMMFDPANPLKTFTGHVSSCILKDGRVLTAYGHYPSQGAAMIRWQP